MMKTFTPIFILLLSILMLVPGSARAEGEDTSTGTGTGTEETSSTIFKYTEVDGGISVDGFKDGSFAKDLEIPLEIDGKPVVAIGKDAFRETDITSIEIPSSVTTIGDYAFCHCESLTSVTFAANSQLTSIGEGTLAGTGITSIEIPSSVTTIGEEAFCDADITSIEIPSSVTTIDTNAFRLCESLTSVTFADNSQLTSIGELAFAGTGITSIEIPSSVTAIGGCAFWCCASLTSVTFADNSQLTSIGGDAFCVTGITSIDIPSSVKTIEGTAFAGCESLTSVTFAANSQLSSIGELAFADTGITSIEIPSSVTTIGGSAFKSCKSLTSVTFADNSQLTSIGREAFNGIGIKSIEIPSSVTTIGCAFEGCESLRAVTFRRIPIGENTIEGYADNLLGGCLYLTTISVPKGTEETYKERLSDYAYLIQGVDIVSDGLKYALNEAKDGLVCTGFSGGEMAEVTIPAKVQGAPVTAIGEGAFRETSITSVSIPSTVKEISNEAFYDCRKLANVSIAAGSQLTTIGQGAFIHCVILEGMVIPSSVETIGVGAFEYCFALKSMVIPSSVKTIGEVAFSDCNLSSMTFQRIPTEENSISGYSADMFLTSSGGSINVSYMFVPTGTVAAYAAQLPSCSDIIMVDGGKVTLTDETGFACEDKTLYRASNLSYERSLKTEDEEPGDDTPGESAQAQYATLCLPFALDLGKTADIFDKVYAPMNTLIHHTKKSTSELEHFILMLREQEPDAIIPAGQPVLVKLSDGTDQIALSNQADELLTAALQPKAEAMTVVDWDGTSGLMKENKQFHISYHGTFQPKEAQAADHLWTFNPNGTFGKQTEGTVHPFRLVLSVEKENEAEGSGSEGSETENPATQSKLYVFSIGVSDGTATGIREIISSEAITTAHPNGSSVHAGAIYDLSGRKVSTAAGSQDVKQLRKGIYVVNGKKVVVK